MTMSDFIKRSEGLWQSFGSSFVRPVVTVAGNYNTGKSTLINGILSSAVSPVDIVPTTPCPIFFHYGESFSAKIKGRKKSIVTDKIPHLHKYAKNYRSLGALERIEINYPAKILKKCVLVDTPGIDAIKTGERGGKSGQARAVTEQVIQASDKVFYLFHQRGLNSQDAIFLEGLKKWQRAGARRNLSLWINCNLGNYDGTSLDETRSVTDQIFGRETLLHTLNTKDPGSVALLLLYLEQELTSELLHQIKNHIKKTDHTIPKRLSKISGIRDDIEFLLSYWEVKSLSEEVLNTHLLTQSLPAINHNLQMMLKEFDRSIVCTENELKTGDNHRGKTVNIADIKEKLYGLLKKLMAEHWVKSLVNPREIGELAGEIRDEEFLVVATGPFSSGKTTFFNALMRNNILPTENKATTPCITQIKYGAEPHIRLLLKQQVLLEISGASEGGTYLNRSEISALEQWLNDPQTAGEIGHIEADTGDGYRPVSIDTLSGLLSSTKEPFYLHDSLQDIKRTRPPLPALIRYISNKKADTRKILKSVRLNFNNDGRLDYDPSIPEEYDQFLSFFTSCHALRVKEVNVYTPAEFFKMATFVDTPGFDSFHSYHSMNYSLIRHSDAYLIFLNGKHILTGTDKENILNVYKESLRRHLSSTDIDLPAAEPEKFFVIINFADALSEMEREKVINYVRQNLFLPDPGKNSTFVPHVYLISSLRALTNDGDDNFKRLCRHIERVIFKRRGAGILRNQIVKTRDLLREMEKNIASGPASDSDHDNGEAILEARQNINKYMKEIASVDRLLDTPGGVKIWKMPGRWMTD